MPKPIRIAPKQVAEQMVRVAQSEPQKITFKEPDGTITEQIIDWRKTVSMGSTLLDKAISGGKSRYGGVPGGIIIEIFGPNSTGKTTLLGELWGNVQRAGGEHKFLDAEHRLDHAYCKTFGINIDPNEIEKPKFVSDLFDGLIGPIETKQVGKGKVSKRAHDQGWTPNKDNINFYGADSLASFAGKMEYDQGDKMGMNRPKQFSEGFRLVKDHVSDYNIIMACSNQTRIDMDSGNEAPTGGNAIGFYSSVRIELYKIQDLWQEIKLSTMDKPVKRIYGILVGAYIYKNSLWKPYRRVSIRLIFDYGIDDIGSNLEWLKFHGAFNTVKDGKISKGWFDIGGKKCVSLDLAIKEVEDQGKEQEIRDMVVDLWDSIEAQATPIRKDKVRF